MSGKRRKRKSSTKSAPKGKKTKSKAAEASVDPVETPLAVIPGWRYGRRECMKKEDWKGPCPFGNSPGDDPDRDNVCYGGDDPTAPCLQCWQACPKCIDCLHAVKTQGDYCTRCIEKIEKAKETNKSCERCAKPGAVLDLGYWVCLACAKRCNECKKPVERGVLRDGEWRCDDCNSKIASAKWAAGSQARKEAMDLWDCPLAIGGHKWDGPAGTKVQDMKCIFCHTDHPGKKHPKCAYCDGLIADHSQAFWKGAKAYCCKACRDEKGPVCAVCLHCCMCTGSCRMCCLLPAKKEAKKDYKYCKKYCPAKDKQEAQTCDHCGNACLSLEHFAPGPRYYCEEICKKMATETRCARCNDAIQGEVKESDIKGKFFCCEACERVYRATHVSPGRTGSVSCANCDKRIKYQKAHKDGDFAGKYFCDSYCADKLYERELLAATLNTSPENEKKAKHHKKEEEKFECLTCEKVVTRRDVVFAEDSPGNFWCSEKCRDTTINKKKNQATCEGCNKTIYTEDTELNTDEYCIDFLSGDYFCSERCALDFRNKQPSTAKNKARVKHTQVMCDYCNKKIDSKDACEDSEFPGELFCSEECMDEREYHHKYARTAASGKTKYRIY